MSANKIRKERTRTSLNIFSVVMDLDKNHQQILKSFGEKYLAGAGGGIRYSNSESVRIQYTIPTCHNTDP